MSDKFSQMFISLKDYTKEWSGQLGKYKIVKTLDNSLSFWSEHFDENGHSNHSSIAETRHIYLEGCQIDQILSPINPTVILEVGFGIGIGLIETLKILANRKMIYHSLELDPSLVQWAIANQEPLLKIDFTFFSEKSYFFSQYQNSEIYIHIGDARERLPKLRDQGVISNVQAIYQDAFSPKKNPRLWTAEWFRELRAIASEQVVLSTYSASSSIRKSMIKAGWVVENRIGIGQKKESTIAKLSGSTPKDLLEHLNRSSAQAIMD